MKNLNNIVQHYSKADEKYVKNIYHMLEMVNNNYISYDIGFCNPYEEKIIDDLIANFNLEKVSLLGDTFERKFITVKPVDYSDATIESKVSFIQINYNQKFQQIQHNQVMGTLYNLGINEDKIGDIFVSENHECQFVCSNDLKPTIMLLMNKVGNIKVSLNEIENITITNKEMFHKIRSTKSLRLDTVIKNLCMISRNEANKKIDKNDIQINYGTPRNNKVEIKIGDLISVKGHGRIIIKDIIFNNRNYNIKYQTTKK